MPLVEAGVKGFKCFLIESGVNEFPCVDESDLRKALKQLEVSSRCPMARTCKLTSSARLAGPRRASFVPRRDGRGHSGYADG